jgi:FKBP-type peptidyl-prolyl cis-trans isomerase
MRVIDLASLGLVIVVLSGCTEAAKQPGEPAASADKGKVGGGSEGSSATSPTADVSSPGKAEKPATDKLQITDLVEGKEAVAEKGRSVTVHYRGTLADGTEFDSSRKHGEPFTFRLGAGEVIPGWDEGVQGMKVGGKRKLVVPPGMAYGPQGVPGAIPANATLTFEVELLDVK